MKLVPLTQGLFAKVDDDDYDSLMQYNWNAVKCGKNIYASRSVGWKGKINIRMHRVVLGITNQNILCDHKDGDGLNNQKSNLRKANYSQSQWERTPY